MSVASAPLIRKSDWVMACIRGELVGFVPPALTGALLVWVGAPEVVLIIGLVLAGVMEGVLLGAAQSKVVSQLIPDVTGWTRATATSAGLAWLAGMGGSSVIQAVGLVGLIVAIPAWIIGLLSMGVLQARRLAAVVGEARVWIPVTTVAWLVGVMMPVAALSAVPNDWPLAVHIASAVAGAVAMGATVGAISAGTLISVAERANEREPVA